MSPLRFICGLLPLLSAAAVGVAACPACRVALGTSCEGRRSRFVRPRHRGVCNEEPVPNANGPPRNLSGIASVPRRQTELADCGQSVVGSEPQRRAAGRLLADTPEGQSACQLPAGGFRQLSGVAPASEPRCFRIGERCPESTRC